MSASSLRAPRGMHDILPEDTPRWRQIETLLQTILQGYGYREIRLPLLENSAVFTRSIGTDTDIVSKEMYEFTDRNGDSLCLRPEGTASVVRAIIEHGMDHNQTQRLWYYGPMFRHERPQQGRLRQFYQLGVESFGFAKADMDAELLLLCKRFWEELGIRELHLKINSLGTKENRQQYRQRLIEYLQDYRAELDADSLRRLQNNPLRILDSKHPRTQVLVQAAPKLVEHLDAESVDHFARLCQLLDANQVTYEVDPYLVRGLDYYEKTVFEWISKDLGAQGTVCAGGRYDRLTKILHGKDIPAAGFAVGIERLLALYQSPLQLDDTPYIYFTHENENCAARALQICEQLRSTFPGIKITLHCSGGTFKAQFKKADKSGALFALAIGENELQNDTVGVKFLREKKSQMTLPATELVTFFTARQKEL